MGMWQVGGGPGGARGGGVTNNRLQKLLRESILFFALSVMSNMTVESACHRVKGYMCVRNGESKKNGLILRDKTLTYYSAATTSETSIHGGRRVPSGLP